MEVTEVRDTVYTAMFQCSYLYSLIKGAQQIGIAAVWCLVYRCGNLASRQDIVGTGKCLSPSPLWPCLRGGEKRDVLDVPWDGS